MFGQMCKRRNQRSKIYSHNSLTGKHSERDIATNEQHLFISKYLFSFL